MRSFLLTLLILVLFPIYSALFITIHELGHVAVMRLLGDDEAWFYLVKVDENSQCLGCTTDSQIEYSWGGKVFVSLGGLIATQTIAISALLLLSLRPKKRWVVTFLSVIALTFSVFDILAQVPQGLYHNLDEKAFRSSVDLVDVMLLIQMKVDASQYLLKGLLLTGALLYLFAFLWFYRRTRRTMEVAAPSQFLVQEGIQIPPGD